MTSRFTRLLPVVLIAISIVTPLAAQQVERDCSLCAGVVLGQTATPAASVPSIFEVSDDTLEQAETILAALTPAQRAKATVLISSKLSEGSDPLLSVEPSVVLAVEWLRAHGPFYAVGFTLEGAEPAASAFAVKRFAVSVQGSGIASRIAIRADVDRLRLLDANGATPYVDDIVAFEKLSEVVAWAAENDPSKRISAIVTAEHTNALFDAATALSIGANRAYLTTASTDLSPAIAAFNREMTGDFAFDSTAEIELLRGDGSARPEHAISFVRGEDLRSTIVIPGDQAAPTIVSLPSDDYANPRFVSATTDRVIADTGTKSGRFLVAVGATRAPFILTAERPALASANVTKEEIDIVTTRGLSVEEVIRNHQSYHSYQKSIEPQYIARNETKLRFSIAEAGETIEATLAGPQFFSSDGRADWVWEDFLINGVRWKYGRIPELPLIQPEKVSQLPLDIQLTNDYRYTLVGETPLHGYETYEVRFEPQPNAPATLPLYRGSVWIDRRSFARVRLSMFQLNLSGEVLSNEEKLDFVPFARSEGRALTSAEANQAPPKELIWLPQHVEAQQVLSTAGRATVVLRSTNFTDIRLNPAGFEESLKAASASNARMVRETPSGLRYLEPVGDGERKVKEGFDKSRLFLVGGLHHDPGLEFPVLPLGGINYFNFDLAGKGLQTNVFFAGIMVAANVTQPSLFGTRTNVGADFFGIAIATENTVYRDGEESIGEGVLVLPANLSLRAGHPAFGFGKIDVSLGISHLSYQRAEDTASTFTEPPNTFLLAPSISARYDRWGWSFLTSYELGTRTKWEQWGNPDEYDEEQKDFARYSARIGKSFYLPKFQRLGVQLDYLDGTDLDRFSKYEIGYFGAERVRGIASGTVRAERAFLGHLSYGFVFSEQFRLEAFYDHAIIDDSTSQRVREPFQGIGIGGQTVGPWGTLLRLDIGKSIGKNAQDDFVANVVFLKLFG